MSTITDLNSQAQTKAVVTTVFKSVDNSYNALLASWQNNIDMVWDAPSPAAVLAEMGINAVTLFTISNATASLLEVITPGCTSDRLAKVLPCTPHNDGTITIN